MLGRIIRRDWDLPEDSLPQGGSDPVRQGSGHIAGKQRGEFRRFRKDPVAEKRKEAAEGDGDLRKEGAERAVDLLFDIELFRPQVHIPALSGAVRAKEELPDQEQIDSGADQQGNSRTVPCAKSFCQS